MENIFLDTNFIIDLIIRPEYSEVASMVLKEGKRRNFKFHISFLSLANYAYIDRKTDKKIIIENIKKLLKVFEVISNDKNDMELAINLNSRDLEDAIQYSSAQKGNCDCIITRNKKDFLEFSDMTILTPQEFLEQLD